MAIITSSSLSIVVMGYLKSLSKTQQESFLSKLIPENSDLSRLIQYVESPKDYRFSYEAHQVDVKDLSIGDTIYVKSEHLWKVELEQKILKGEVIDGLLHPGTIVDFEFFPETKVLVNFHTFGSEKETKSINTFYLASLDLV